MPGRPAVYGYQQRIEPWVGSAETEYRRLREDERRGHLGRWLGGMLLPGESYLVRVDPVEEVAAKESPSYPIGTKIRISRATVIDVAQLVQAVRAMDVDATYRTLRDLVRDLDRTAISR